MNKKILERSFIVIAMAMAPLALAANATSTSQQLNFQKMSINGGVILEKATNSLPGGFTVYRTVGMKGNTISIFSVGPNNKVVPMTPTGGMGSSKSTNNLSTATTNGTATCPCSTTSTPILGTPLTVVTTVGGNDQVISQFIYNSDTGAITVLKQ